MNRVVIAETARRQFSAPFIVLNLLTLIFALGSASMRSPGSLWPGLIALMALIVGCQNIGPEFSSGTLQLILAKPVNRSVYLLSRVAGAVLVIAAVAALCGSVELIGRVIGGTAPDSANAVVATAANLALDSILVCSLLAFFGSFTRSYVNIALYLVLQIGLDLTGGAITMLVQMPDRGGVLAALGRFLTANPWIARSVAFINRNLFPDSPRGAFDGEWTMLVLTNASIALLIACLLFRRREVPYGAD